MRQVLLYLRLLRILRICNNLSCSGTSAKVSIAIQDHILYRHKPPNILRAIAPISIIDLVKINRKTHKGILIKSIIKVKQLAFSYQCHPCYYYMEMQKWVILYGDVSVVGVEYM